MIKFKVTGISTSAISVTYEDGTSAVVPIFKGQTKAEIIETVCSYNNTVVAFDSDADVPVKVGDDLEQAAAVDRDVDYREARKIHYPDLGKQFDSLYWARQGDDTQLKAVDATIKLVKDTIPKGTTYKESKVQSLLDA